MCAIFPDFQKILFKKRMPKLIRINQVVYEKFHSATLVILVPVILLYRPALSFMNLKFVE